MLKFLSGKHDVSLAFTSGKSIEMFDWQDIMTVMKSGLPTLYSAVCASMPRKLFDAGNQLTYAEVITLLCISLLVLF